MKKISKQKIILILIFVCVGLVLGVTVLIGYFKQNLISTASERSKGDPKAPIKIVEFIDFQCDACALGAEYLNKCMKENSGVVRREVKYFPLGKHQHAMTSTRYAECAARQGKFWLFHDLLLQRQGQWAHLDDAVDVFGLMAKETSLDLDRLDVCLGDKTVEKVIKNDKRDGQSIEVMAAPTFFVNEKKIVGKANLEPELNRLIKNIGK
jgi:protein-disulfide isomerase